MNILGLLKKTHKNNKKSSSLDLRKTQSSPVIIIRNTPTHLKPILTNYSNLTPPNEQDETTEEQRRQTSAIANDDDSEQKPTTTTTTTTTTDQQESEALAERLRVIKADDMELLLSMETQARMDHQAEQQERHQQQQQQQQQHQHPKRLKFALPETPLREPTPPEETSPPPPPAAMGKRWSLPEDAIRQDMKKKSKTGTTPSATKWTRYLLHTKPDPGPQRAPAELHYGCKVKLIRSPIKTTAYVRYIGPVHFAPGEWIGVELERAGKTET
jgi:hypothetical protein